MPRDLHAEDETTLLPRWTRRERTLAFQLPYVSLVDDATVRTRGDELFRCIRLEGIDSGTMPEPDVLRVRDRLAALLAQSGRGFSFYVHKVSRGIDTRLVPVVGDGFDAHLDARWQRALAGHGLRDRSLTLTVLERPDGARVPLRALRSASALRERTEARLTRLDQVCAFVRATLGAMRPRMLHASTGELLGFLGALGTGRETPLVAGSATLPLAEAVAGTRVTFDGATFELAGGVQGHRYGTSFAVKTYPAATWPTMLDELGLPADMVVTHSFTPVNPGLMAGRIKRQQRLMRSAEDGAISLMEELTEALDDLEAGRLIFGDHHMTATIFAESREVLELIGAEVRQAAAASGAVLVNEAFAARAHYFAQHPGNGAKRARKAAITNANFADLAALHRTPLGKTATEVPWGTPITILPTPDRSAFRFSHHEAGSPEKEPTSGHTLVLGRPGAGKSVLSAFLMAQARRADARLIAFDYRHGLEMAVRALGGRYETIRPGEPTGLNPLVTQIDASGQAWLSDWLAALLEGAGEPLTPVQAARLQDAVRQNAGAGDAALRNWDDLASLTVSADDGGDLRRRLGEWCAGGRHGWVFGTSRSDDLDLSAEVTGFDLTGVLDAEGPRERMAVLSYLFRRVEQLIDDRRPTIIVVDEAWKALDNDYFADRLGNWLVTARKQNAIVVMLTQYASQLERSAVGQTLIEAVPTQVLLPNARARAEDYAPLGLNDRELGILLGVTRGRTALVRDDRGSTVVDVDLSPLGPLLTILGGMEKGERLVGPGWRDDSEFWRPFA